MLVTDPVDRVREINPVDSASLEVPADVAARSLTPPGPAPRRTRRVVAILGPVAVTTAVVAIVLIGSGSSSLSDRAFAAISGSGVVHWRTEITNPGGIEQATEGWATDQATHVLDFDVANGRPKLTSDTRIADGRQTMWTAVSQDVSSSPASTETQSIVPSGDPAASFRDAYSNGTLRRVNDTTYEAQVSSESVATYTLDPDSALPTRLVIANQSSGLAALTGGDGRTVIDFVLYERLERTSASLDKLDLLPHDRKSGPTPAELFSVLRSADALDADEQNRLETLARRLDNGGRFELQADQVRAIGDGAWLLPGTGQVCLAVAVGANAALAASCATTAQVAQRGIAVESDKTYIALPDGLRSADLRLANGTSRTERATGPLLRLPERGIKFSLQP